MKDNRISMVLCIFFLVGIIGSLYYMGNTDLVLKSNDFRMYFDNKEFDDEFDNVSMSKSCVGKLDKDKKKKIINEMVGKIGGRIIDVQNISNKYGTYSKEEMVRLYGYSRLIKNDRKYMGRKINFSIVITYNENDNITNVYFGSPIVNIDY